MKKEELEGIVKSMLEDGISLSKIQDSLTEKYSYSISFMDLRLLASSLDISWQEEKSESKATEIDNPNLGQDDKEITIELNSVKKPDEMFSGSARFLSGKVVYWAINQLGQLSLGYPDGVEKLSQEEITTFENALKEKLT